MPDPSYDKFQEECVHEYRLEYLLNTLWTFWGLDSAKERLQIFCVFFLFVYFQSWGVTKCWHTISGIKIKDLVLHLMVQLNNN